uniref:BPTI/Kunitz inhibitor domain-containing protein n=1 Tax=Panagrolaimus sp. ES5 TaxID=591445 RepID=A0AC34FDW5_9BILA
MGEKKTQIVLRWFAKNGECCSYPYGYCPGTLVKDDITLRTKEECELYCLSNSAQIASSFVEDVVAASESPFEMELNKNEVASGPNLNNVESVSDTKEADNSTSADEKMTTNTNVKSHNENLVASTPSPPTTVSFTDLVLNNNFSTTASFTDLVLSQNFTTTTPSFIDFVLHNNSASFPIKTKASDSNASNKLEAKNSVPLNPSTRPSESTTTKETKKTKKSSTNLNPQNESTTIRATEPARPTSTTSDSINVIDSEINSASISSSPTDSKNAAPEKTNNNLKSVPVKEMFHFEPLPPTPSPLFPTLANPIQGDVDGGHELEEVFPPGYGPEIDENNKTRVILHSDIPEPIPIAPPNEESDAHAKELVSEMSESDTKKDVVVAEKKDDTNVLKKKEEAMPQLQQPQQNASIKPVLALKTNAMNEPKMETATKNPQSGSEIELKILKKSFDEIKRTLLPMKVELFVAMKSCMKILPYRSMCPSGMPSQFTLRWFVKAGMCCAYPFGYCHGELVFNEEAIKTKKECEELCLGKIDSEKPYHLF